MGVVSVRFPSQVPLLSALMAFALLSSPVGAGAAATFRECLTEATAAAEAIKLGGDQSAARRDIACTLAESDPKAALDLAGGIRRPADAARALAAVAVVLWPTEPDQARQAANAAGRLLLRIVEPARRAEEERLLLDEIAIMGQDALQAAGELKPEEAQAAVVMGLVRRKPAAALDLVRQWQVAGLTGDQVRASAAVGLAESDPDRALTVLAGVGSDAVRERALWQIAAARPPAESFGLAQRVGDPLVRSAILARAAVRLCPDSADGALESVQEVAVARESALAQISVALAAVDLERALGVAAGLGARPRRWALSRIAAALAPTAPARAAELLAEAGAGPDAARQVAAEMVGARVEEAVKFARALPAGEARDAALAAVAAGLAEADPARARGLVWEIESPAERTRAVAPIALALARVDADAATSLLGLVSDGSRALQLRAEVAAAAAPRDPAAAERLLKTLPPSHYRSEAALRAAASVLAGRGWEEGVRLAAIGTEKEPALRWLLPVLSLSQTASPIHEARAIGSPYLRALALVDAARMTQQAGPKAKPAPARAEMIRPVVEWEGS